MAYGAAGAYRLDIDERTDERARPRLGVVEGGGADARARQGVAPEVVSRARAVVVVIAALTLLGVARVSITTATVGVLAENARLEGAIEEAEEANSNLRVERSILSSSSRVERIATQNLGMVPAGERDVVRLPVAAGAAAAGDGAGADAASAGAGGSSAEADDAATDAGEPDGVAGEGASAGADDPEAVAAEAPSPLA